MHWQVFWSLYAISTMYPCSPVVGIQALLQNMMLRSGFQDMKIEIQQSFILATMIRAGWTFRENSGSPSIYMSVSS